MDEQLDFHALRNTYHAVQSLIKPAAIVIAPTFVPSSLSSAKIRAKTGKAYDTLF
jgi:hypothetical protein